VVDVVSGREPIGDEIEILRVAKEHFRRAAAEPRMKTLGEQMIEAFGPDPQWTDEQVERMRKRAPK
jgi:hypothetical protein